MMGHGRDGFACLGIILIFAFCNGQLHVGNDSVTRTAAAVACLSQPGLSVADGRYISLDQLRQINTLLQEGESAWVANMADFSDFAVYVGCFKEMPLVKVNYLFDNNSFYKCSKACKSSTARYIGLQKNNCYCLELLPNQLNDNRSPYCNIECNASLAESCGGDSSVAVYAASRQDDIGFGPEGPGYDQCVRLTKTTAITARTESCDAACSNCAFICKADPANRCQFNDICIFYGHRKYTWREANFQCTSRYEGILFNATVGSFANLNRYLIDTFEFWTGQFRTFEMTESMTISKQTDSCVAIRKFSNIIRFEATNCSESKRYICSGSNPPDGAATLGQSDDPFPLWIIIVVALAVIFILVVLLIICCVTRRRRKFKTDFRDTKSIISTETGSHFKLRYALDESDMDRIASGDHGLRATLELNRAYEAEWSGDDLDSPRSSRSPTRLHSEHPETDTMKSFANTIERSVEREEKILAEEPRETTSEWLVYSGHSDEKAPDGSPKYKSLPRNIPVDGGVIYAMPAKDKDSQYIDRPIRTYLDYMYCHLKRNIEHNQSVDTI